MTAQAQVNLLDLAAAVKRAREHLVERQSPVGWWKGELLTNATMDAEDLLLRQFLGVLGADDLAASARWIRSRQRSPLFLDFLEGKVDYDCTAWAIRSYSLLGWQRPCYLMADGYAKTYRDLIEQTDWDAYGRGKDVRCNNCMAHCGYEPTAVLATIGSLKQSLRALRERG